MHWSGLTRRGRQTAVFVGVVTLLIDLLLIALDYAEHGLRGISGGYFLVDFWDVTKAVAIGSLLLFVAHRTESVSLRVLGFVFLLLALEDIITLHGLVGLVLRRLSGGLVPRRVGELIAFAGFGLVVFVLVWARTPSKVEDVRRARLVITGLLVAIFFFSAVIDFFAVEDGSATSRVTGLIEESGERLVLTLTLAYAAGLASRRER